MKIFLLEDDVIYQEILVEDLEQASHEVELYKCLKGATDAIKAGHYDLLIIDINLPEDEEKIGEEDKVGGIEVLESLHVDPDYRFPAVLIESAWGCETNEKRIKDLGLNSDLPDTIVDYFRKPYNFDELVETVNDIARLRKVDHG